MKKSSPSLVTEKIANRIVLIRGHRVMIDHDLARLYKVPTKVLNQAVKRNSERFPGDFMFRLTAQEKKEVVTNCDHLARLKFSPALPYAFTEHGALMLANVLNSQEAVDVSLSIIRAFIRLREVLAADKELAKKLAELEQKIAQHDEAIRDIITVIRQLTTSPVSPRRRIGFHP